jgi:hypothetical protein
MSSKKPAKLLLSDPLLLPKIFHEEWTMGMTGNGMPPMLGKGIRTSTIYIGYTILRKEGIP